MESRFTIYPELKKIIKINKFSIQIQEVQLFQSAKIAVILYDIDGVPVDNRLFIIEGYDYTAWAADDSYIINWVKVRLGEELTV